MLQTDFGRWNSTYDMLERSLQMKAAIELYATGKGIEFDKGSWEKFEVIKKFLGPFKAVSVYMCADTYPTLSMAVPNYNKLISHIMKHGDQTAPGHYATSVDSLHNACVASYAKITEYYIKTSDCFTIATVLDPRLKLEFYEEHEREEIFQAVDLIFQRDYAVIQQDITIESEEEDDDIIHRSTSNLEGSELRKYCDTQQHCLPGKLSQYTAKDILKWWKSHKEIYPTLSQMARDYLAIPGTSAASERLFSSGKNMITDARNRLHEDTIEAHECLKSWIK